MSKSLLRNEETFCIYFWSMSPTSTGINIVAILDHEEEEEEEGHFIISIMFT